MVQVRRPPGEGARPVDTRAPMSNLADLAKWLISNTGLISKTGGRVRLPRRQPVQITTIPATIPATLPIETSPLERPLRPRFNRL